MTLIKQQKYFCSEYRFLAKQIQCIEKICVLNLTNSNNLCRRAVHLIKLNQAYLTVFSVLIEQTVRCLCNFHHILSDLHTVCLDESKVNVNIGYLGTSILWLSIIPTLLFVKLRTQIFSIHYIDLARIRYSEQKYFCCFISVIQSSLTYV